MRIFVTILFMILVAGCIRVKGNVGYQKYGTKDSPPQSKSLGFDTADYVPGQAPGSITV